MSYFKTSYATLQQLARTGRFEDVAGFLVLARHASGLAIGGFAPYTLSGAGANSIHEKAAVSEETARGVLERLKEQGVIQAVSPDIARSLTHARWKIAQGPLDLFLPHSFVDPLKKSRATSALKRLKAVGARPSYAEVLKGVSDAELRLDALMLMLAIYRHTNMELYGGLDPRCVLRAWEVKSQIDKGPGVRWGAEPKTSTASAFEHFMSEALPHRANPQKELTEQEEWRFWNAWLNLVQEGLMYEAVCLYDTDPEQNPSAQHRYTIRVNDYHAGAIVKEGDPSLLREFECLSGAELGYYTPPINDREEPEAMWVILPDRRGHLVGIWRPRLRAATPDAGAWIEKEDSAIETTLRRLSIA